MLIYATHHYVLSLPPEHRFPMPKYARLAERVAAVASESMRIPRPASDDELARVHSRDYIAAVSSGSLDAAAMKRIGFPWSPEMVERSRRSSGATIAACRTALATGCGVNLAGGTHHAHRDHGAGYCVFNDAAVAIRALQAERRVERALIVDLDVHQGDGTADIMASDPKVVTFSMHGRGNYPFRKSTSTLDIELADGTGDDAYLAALTTALPRLIARANPDIVVYLAGADPYEGDRLGRLRLTKSGLAERDRIVLTSLHERAIPVAITMGGGYAESIDDVVDIHFATIALALSLFHPSRRAIGDSCNDAVRPRPLPHLRARSARTPIRVPVHD